MAMATGNNQRIRTSIRRKWMMTAGVLTLIVIIMAVAVWSVSGKAIAPIHWKSETGTMKSGIALPNGAGYIVGSSDNSIIRLDAEGKNVWKTPTSGSPLVMDLSPDGSRIAAATEDRKLVIVDSKTGKQTASWNLIYPPLSIKWSKNDVIGVATGIAQKSRVYGYNLQGQQVWKYEKLIGVNAIGASDQGTFFIGTDNSQVIAIDSKGNQKWVYVSHSSIRSLVGDGEGVVFADEGGFYGKLGVDGSLIWKDHYDGTPVWMDYSPDAHTMYIVDRTGLLKAIDESNGVIRTTFAAASVLQPGDVVGVSARYSSDKILLYGEGIWNIQASSLINYSSLSALLLKLRIALAAAAALAALAIAMSIVLRYERASRRLRYTLKFIWRSRTAYALLLPTIGLLLVFSYYPTASAFFHSFTEWHPGGYTYLIGFDNYVKVFHSHYFWIGFGNLIKLIATNFVKLSFPLVVAVLVFHTRSAKARYLLRNVFVFPIIVPGIVGILLWNFIYDPNYGMLNSTLRSIGLGSWAHTWLGDTQTALPAIIVIGLPWVGPFAFLIFYGGLIGIPGEIFEAAKMDGIGRLRRFFLIELPLLTGQIRLLLVLTFIGTMQDFSTIFLTTQGGPMDSTYVPALEMYFAASKFNDYGYASALGVVLFLIILSGTILQLRIRSSTEYDAG